MLEVKKAKMFVKEMEVDLWFANIKPKMSMFLKSFVLFIPYFCPLVFGISVTLVAWFSFLFFLLAHLALQNVNKDYVIFSYFYNFVAKSDQKPKNGMNKTLIFFSLDRPVTKNQILINKY